MFENKKHGPRRADIMRVEKWVKQHEIINFIRMMSTEASWEWVEEQGRGKGCRGGAKKVGRNL